MTDEEIRRDFRAMITSLELCDDATFVVNVTVTEGHAMVGVGTGTAPDMQEALLAAVQEAFRKVTRRGPQPPATPL